VSTPALLVNAVIALALIIGYIVLTALGDDGTALLGLIGGQGLAIVGAKGADAAARNGAG
jgi:hypothetical protein